jgi:NitT/TauT family transport system substrate-binding protein
MRLVAGFLAGILTVAGCGSRDNADSGVLPRVKLLLNWYPEAEHGGFYAALVEGFYEAEGIDVEIVKGGPTAPVLPLVARGDAEFGISNADGILLGRAQEMPVVAVMAPLQTSPRCIMVHASSGIDDFDDLRDMTIAMNASQTFYHFLVRHVSLEGVRIVPYNGSVAPFLANEKLAQQGYVFSEPIVARGQGAEPRVLLLADLGFNPYTSALVTSEAMLADRPEIVEKMVVASIRGWEHYLAHPESTNQYIHSVNPEMDLETLAAGMEALEPLVWGDTARHGIGHMTLARWQTLLDQLVDSDQIDGQAVDAVSAFTSQFLPADAP